MGRRHRRASAPEPRPLGGAHEEVEEHPDGDWVVRRITGSSSTKTYRCPGCDQEIRPATPHVVAWQVDDADNRRHWHRPCFDNRLRRGVKVHRSKNAPRHG